MKVKVCYMVYKEEIVEVDDKYTFLLRDPLSVSPEDGAMWDNMMDDLDAVLTEKIGHEVEQVFTEDGNDLIYESF